VRRLGPAATVASASEAGTRIKPGAVVLVGRPDAPKWVVVGCPCRCGEALWVNLMSAQGPHWTLNRGSGGAITIAPSLDVTTCGSHFWIRRGRFVWV
jgi:Family of unknown function (DUF6527)